MYYALVHFSSIDIEKINVLRKKYDPTFAIIEPHITLVFPIADTQSRVDDLEKHTGNTLRHWRSFEVHIGGFEKSWDHWLFLAVAEGRDKLIQLHDELYSDTLSAHLRKDIQYSPHISLGLFVKDEDRYNLKHPEKLVFDENKYSEALKEANKLKLDYRSIVDTIMLIKISDDFKTIVKYKEFSIG